MNLNTVIHTQQQNQQQPDLSLLYRLPAAANNTGKNENSKSTKHICSGNNQFKESPPGKDDKSTISFKGNNIMEFITEQKQRQQQDFFLCRLPSDTTTTTIARNGGHPKVEEQCWSEDAPKAVVDLLKGEETTNNIGTAQDKYNKPTMQRKRHRRNNAFAADDFERISRLLLY